MIEARELSRHAVIRHGFFTREGGHSTGLFTSLNCGFGSGDDLGAVARNRQVVSEKLGTTPGGLLTVWQHHSADVVAVTSAWAPMESPRADAMVTALPGLAIAVLTADCAPILFVEPAARVIGAAHAGWKGALAGVTDATVAAMERLGASRSRITAVIGPTISQPAYEVGPELYDRFVDDHPANAQFFSPSLRRSHYYFDLPKYLEKRLSDAGIDTVVDLQVCTYRDEQRFFSFRRVTHRGQERYGRQISAICLIE
jgi:polyphenol oxidase